MEHTECKAEIAPSMVLAIARAVGVFRFFEMRVKVKPLHIALFVRSSFTHIQSGKVASWMLRVQGSKIELAHVDASWPIWASLSSVL